jgi:carbamoyl-phosphate synthase small subunit
MISRKAVLYLENGAQFEGQAFGAEGEELGEVVFNTSMTGYQEVLTDPSYAGQIVIMTQPEIGNYGTNPEDSESRQPFVRGFVVRECSRIFSNWRADSSLDDYLKKYHICGIAGLDTRALVRQIREVGAMRGIISTVDFVVESLQRKVLAHPTMAGSDHVRDVTTHQSYRWEVQDQRFKVVVMDFGIKTNILRSLAKRGCDLTVMPASTSAGDILDMNPDGIFLSNGPGDPEPLDYVVSNVRKLIGQRPMFGICLGHQIMGLALGGKTFKLKFGHRGANQPVKNVLTSRVEITSQNHGFAVDPDSLPDSQVIQTHINLNDQTMEGLQHRNLPLFSVQYHPEASPGPHDSYYLFDDFIEMMS